MEYVKKLEGKTNDGRKEALINILNKKKHNIIKESYPVFGDFGENISVEIGQGKKEILLTAHYDVFKNSPGANDNASSIAVLIDALDRLRNYKPRNKIKVIFFGDSETGGVGSKYHVAVYGITNIVAVYNLALTGMGDVVGVWPISYEIGGSKALKNLRQVLKKNKIRYEEAEKLPLFFSDHEPFRNAGLMDAFSLSLVPNKDMEATKKFVENAGAKGFWMYLTGKIPLMFKLYHTKNDTSKYLKESSLKLMSDVVYKATLRLDSKS